MEEVDGQRRAAGLTQEAFAPLVHMTQGHYSKLLAGKAHPGPKAVTNLREWLSGRAAVPPTPSEREAEMRHLAADIAMQCMRLTELAARS